MFYCKSTYVLPFSAPNICSYLKLCKLVDFFFEKKVSSCHVAEANNYFRIGACTYVWQRIILLSISLSQMYLTALDYPDILLFET